MNLIHAGSNDRSHSIVEIVRRLLSLSFIISTSLLSQVRPTGVLSVGDVPPDFSLPYATRDSIATEELKLSSLVGTRPIVLAFYPADWSSGCTKEVCSFRDNFAALSDVDAEILGISGDYVYSHHQWAKHHDLPFKLLSDHSHAVAKSFNSYNEQTGFNRRTIYVISRKGTIAYIDLHYSVRDMESLDKLLNVLRKMK